MPALEAWRKIAAASWNAPTDPQIYGDFEVDAEALLDYVAEVRDATGVHLTVTHLVCRAVAHALAENPDVNVRLCRGRFVPRETVDVFVVATTAGGRELSGVKIESADTKSAVEVAHELEGRVARIRSGHEERSLGSAKRVLAHTPARALRLGLRAATWLVSDVGISLERFGLPSDAFGSAIVSSVSAFGAERAYGPLNPWYRVPLLALVSEVRQKPAVVDGHVVPRPLLALTATMDHRYLDGAHAGRLARSAKAYLADPRAFEPPLEQPATAAAGR